MDEAHLARVIRQHAETSRLLGVGFVPVYTISGGDRAAADPSPAPEPARITVAAVEAPTASAPRSERYDSAPLSFAAPELPHAAIDIKPMSRDRADVQRALDALRERYIKDAPHKQFVTAFTNIVFGEGDPVARLMFVGEAPGAEEDKTGRPFVGRAGQLLNKMIVAMGLAREQVYIANVLKTRPPDNATPTGDEIRICAPYLFRQIAIIQPEAIVALGLPATKALLDTTDSMSRLRGRWASFRPPLAGAAAIPVMPTYHPAFLLRSYTDENRGKVWSDLRQVMVRLGLATERAKTPN
jgi:uracil-DNA glycosylase